MSTAAEYRKRPVVISAMEYDGSNDREVVEWITSNGGVATRSHDGDPGKVWHINIETLEGVMRCDMGSWVIRGVRGEFYPCDGDIFALTYEAARS